MAKKKTTPYNHQKDSIQLLLNSCTTDTCKVRILSKLFWKYAESDMDRVKYIGDWAYELYKNSSNTRIRTDVYDIKAFILRNASKFDSSYLLYETALTESSKIRYLHRMGWCYHNMAFVDVAMGNKDRAILNMQKSNALFLQQKDSTELITSFGLIADCFNELGRFDSAAYYYKSKLNIAQKHMYKYEEIFAYFELAGCYKMQNNTPVEVQYLNQALRLSDNLNDDKLTGQVYSIIGDFFFREKRSLEIALVYYKRSLANFIKADNKFSQCQTYNSMGDLFLEQGNSDLALEYNQKALQIAIELNNRHLLSGTYKSLGFIYKKLGKQKLALDNFVKCFEIGCTTCPKIRFHDALVESGNLCFDFNNKEEAFKYYNQSLKLAENFHANTEIAKSQLKIGNYYWKINQLNSAEKFYIESLNISKEANDMNLIMNCSDTLAHFYIQKNDYQSAFKYLHIARNMEDSLFQMNKKADIANLQMRFEFEKINNDAEAKDILAQQEIKQQKNYRNSLLLISGLLGLLGFVVFINYKRKIKANNLLAFQKQEIENISNQLHDADQMKLKFFTNISHELRTPLTLIISPIVKLIKNNPDEKTYALVLRNAYKLQNLINQLLDIAKLDKGELKLNQGLYNFNKQVRIISSMFQSIAEEKNISFTVIEKEKNMTFNFDAEKLEQVVNNLLSNAFKFTPLNGKIKLVIDKQDNNAIIKIWDSGIGIPQESISKVFDRFYQSEYTITRNFEGSGIGLALAKELVELHKGNIKVNSEIGHWTEFIVSIPIIKLDESKIIEDYSSEKPFVDLLPASSNEGNSYSKKKGTVLLVEDNDDLRIYLRDSLSVFYNVIEAKNGTEGIELALEKIPDLIISDVMMPVTDGYKLTSMIREHIETSHIPVILLTAKAGRDSKIEGLQKGATDYLNKPFDEEELFLKIRNILADRQKSQKKFRNLMSINPSEIEADSLDEQLVRKLTTIVERFIADPNLNVDFLSTEIGMSRQNMHKKLKSLTGYSPNEFIRTIRLKRAAQLIHMKTGSISEIAFQTGFENLSYFTKRFKDFFEVLPSEY